MVRVYHCTSADRAINIYKSGIFLTGTISGDACINFHPYLGGVSSSHQAEHTGCFIHFEWRSSSVNSGGGIAVEQGNYDELYTEWPSEFSPGEIWRLRIRSPYDGKDLVMTHIEFDKNDLYSRLIREYNTPETLTTRLLIKFFKKESKAVINAREICAQLASINHELQITHGKPIKVRQST